MTYGLPLSAPVSIPFSGTTDVNGNFNYTSEVRAAYWTTVKVVAESTGNPKWSVKTRDGVPLDYANGPRASMGPFSVAPVDVITINVQGQPSASVTGHILGKEFARREDAAEALHLASNPLTVGSVGPLNKITTLVIVAAVGTNSYVGSVPLGTIGIIARLIGGTLSTFTITENASGFVVPTRAPNSLENPVYLAWPVPDNTPVTITATSAGAATVDVLAVVDPEAVDIIDRSGRVLGQVSMSNASPALWQAPNKSPAYTEGSNTAVNGATLVAGVVGQTIRVFGWEIEQEGGAAFVALRDSSIAAPNGRFATNNAVGAANGGGSGSPLTLGAGVIIDSVAGATTARIALYYSQG